MAVLLDVLAANLRVVFCGTAAGKRSAEIGAYYAGRGNKFWKTLHEAGFTPRLFAPSEFPRLLEYGIGLTDLAKRASGADATLKLRDFSAQTLRRLIEKYQPNYIAFTSKRAAREYFGADVEYGLQYSQLERTRFFVLTSPSGLATRYWEQGRHWYELAELISEPMPRIR
jgi:TDG/mug DNA glycosylase family protein